MLPRLARLRRLLNRERIGGLLVCDPANLRYLSGFTGSNGVMVVTRRRAMFYTDFRYEEQVRTQVKGCRVQILERDLYSSIPAGAVKGTSRLGIEADNLTLHRYRLLRRHLKGTRLVPVCNLVSELRRTKEPAELRQIARAQQLTDRVFRQVLGMVEPGITERDIALEIEWQFRQKGELAFPLIIASGPNSAKPHAGVSDRRLRKGDAITFDIGCRINGYCSDMTRTVFLGMPPDEMREAYAAVLEAQRRALAAVAPGVPCRKVDAAARDYLIELGYGHYFRHSTGHGVGIDVHEQPAVARFSRDRLRPGDVVTIEPGVYIPGLGGIRIEDMVAVTPRGCQNLTKSPKQMMIL